MPKSIKAAIIGIVALAVFMILVYRVPGVVATFALLLYAIIVVGANVAIKATITLPVIAAFLLSVGMAVDANVIIFERIKEELRPAKRCGWQWKPALRKPLQPFWTPTSPHCWLQ